MAAPVSTLLTKTFEGLSAGINQALRPHDIPDNAAVWLQDIILDVPGIIRRRGPLTKVASSPTITVLPWGAISVLGPDNTYRTAFLSEGASENQLNYVSSDGLSYASDEVTASGRRWSSSHGPIYDAKPLLNGGSLIGWSSSFAASTGSQLVMWKGARKATYSTGTVTATQGSKTVTGAGTSWSANAEKGMFVFANSEFAGVIDTVDSDTQITLEQGSLIDAAALSPHQLSSIRTLHPRLVKGRITCSTASTAVTGAGTKFSTIAGDSGYIVFRKSDMAYIGSVASVESNTGLTLDANAAVDMANDEYVILRTNGPQAYPSAMWTLGFLNAVYADRQFYANQSEQQTDPQWYCRVWFSDPTDPEGLDTNTDDGDFFDVTSQNNNNTPITAMAGLPNALAIFKDRELFTLTGSDPTTFVLRKIADVGAFSPMSVLTWKNTIIFAGRAGVFAFDGVTLTELSVELGQYWKDALQAYNLNNDRAYATVYRNHLILHLTAFDSGYSPTRGSISTPITTDATWMLNLDTGAWTFHTNLGIRGAALQGTGLDPWLLVATGTATGAFADADTLWTSTGPDTVTCKGMTAGPDLYIETKRYTISDPELKKNFKQLNMTYKLVGDTLSMDTVPGLSSTGTPISKNWPQALDWTNKRRKFQKRSTHIGFRFYETLGNVTQCEIGPWMLGFKPLRAGRT